MSSDIKSQVTKQVKVGNRKLAVTCVGEGQPTVVLESGLGDDASIWANLQPEIATFTRVCAYSRAGLGKSDPAPGQRTVQNVVDDLETLLADSSIKGPFVLVGHSIGGLIVNMYAHQHPQQVAGLVLVDGSHPNQEGEFRKTLPTALNDAFDLHNTSPENWDLLAATKQGETEYTRPGSLGNKPVVVLTADTNLLDQEEIDWTKENIWANYNEDIYRVEKEVWKGLQEQYAELSSHTRHTVVKGNLHYIQRDKPEVVVEAVRQVVEAFRTSDPLRLA